MEEGEQTVHTVWIWASVICDRLVRSADVTADHGGEVVDD
jgi:hypothetical protein